MYERLSLLDNEKYKIKKPIRLIELFAGIGAQSKALERLKVPFEHHMICEWAIPSIKAYPSIHRDYLPNYGIDFSKDLSKEEIANELVRFGISSDYNSPVDIKKLSKRTEQELRLIYNSIKWSNNKVDISRVHWSDLNIVDQDKYEYILTYSFPCQDLSLAGNQAGMKKGEETRSGLLWQVERLLLECKEHNCLPQVLLMENVTQIHSVKNVHDFNLWQESLRQLGYESVWQDLNAKDYGIPQNRDRTFMISILNGGYYEFPKKKELKLKLKDLLEDNVDEKYYLSQKMVDCFMSDGTGAYPRKERFLQNINRESKDVGNAVTTLAGNRPTDNFVIDDKLFLSKKMINYIASDNEKWTGNNDKSLVNKTIASTINTKEGTRRCDASNYIAYGMPENTDLKKVIYGNKRLDETLLENDVKDGDYIDAYNRQVKSDISGTITTGVSSRNETFIAEGGQKLKIKNNTQLGYLEAEEGDGVDISSRMPHHRGTVQKGITQTLLTDAAIGVVVKK